MTITDPSRPSITTGVLLFDDAEERFEHGDNGHAGEAELEPAAVRTAQPAVREDGNRFANFIRGSWRELQRVQWPDRQQVGQARLRAL